MIYYKYCFDNKKYLKHYESIVKRLLNLKYF